MLCPGASHFILYLVLFQPWKSPDVTEKIVDWDVKHQCKQKISNGYRSLLDLGFIFKYLLIYCTKFL